MTKEEFDNTCITVIATVAHRDARQIVAWYDKVEKTMSLPTEIHSFATCVRTTYNDRYIQFLKGLSSNPGEGGENMSPQQQEQEQSQPMTVTYSIEEGVSREQARELVKSSIPKGLTISSFENESPQESN